MKISWTTMVTWSLPLILTACNYPGASQGTVQPRPQAQAPAPVANHPTPKPSTPVAHPSPAPVASGSVTPVKAASATSGGSGSKVSLVSTAQPSAKSAAPAIASTFATNQEEETLNQSLSLLNAKNLEKQDDGNDISKGDETLKIEFLEDVTIPARSNGDVVLQNAQWSATAPNESAFSCNVTYSFDSDDESLVIHKGTVYTFQRIDGSTDSSKIRHVTLSEKGESGASISILKCDGNGRSFLAKDLVDAFGENSINAAIISK